jgi:hypothetical protein
MDSVHDDRFIDLSEFDSIRSRKHVLRGNVIKRDRVVQSGIQQVSVADGAPGQPTVYVHRHGDDVDSVEFVCSCGRTATVKFDYGGE